MPTDRIRRARRAGLGERVAEAISKRPLLLALVLLLITAGLSLPMLHMVPEETASQSPVNEITTTQELIGERFSDAVFDYFVLIESAKGDVLTRESLLEILENSAALRADGDIAAKLVTVRDQQFGIDIQGTWTLADTVDQLLRQTGITGGLAAADEALVQGDVAADLAEGGPGEWGLASQAAQDDSGVWHSPAIFIRVSADNEALGGGGFLATIGTDSLDKEYFARELIEAIRGDGALLNVWSPAADTNLTSNEQGELAGPFIGMTIAAVLLIVGLVFRSYWAVAIAGAALGILMIWLKGGSNLIGFKSDQILSIILPISMISFGIDSAFHGIGRMREEQRRGLESRRAFAVGFGAVFGALVLAASSDAAAFLSNAAAGIESVVQFSFAAAMATIAAFVLLGMATPLMISVVEQRVGNRSLTRLGAKGDFVFGLVAAAMATAAVMVLIFISTELGLTLLGAYLIVALLFPYAVNRRTRGPVSTGPGSGQGSRRLGSAVGTVASRPLITVLIAAVITGGALWGAARLEVTFDVENFFSPDSDFVVGLDKTAEYLGEQGGEPAQVYVETDLTSPQALDAIRQFTIRVAAAEDNPLAVDSSGEVRFGAGVLDLIDDVDEFIHVGTSEALARLYADGLDVGIRDTSGGSLWSANDVGTVLWNGEEGAGYATVLTYQIPDTRDQENVIRTREILEPLAQDLERALVTVHPDSNVVVTGSAVYRDDQLAAIRRAMLLALPIALAACFAIAAVFMRSLRYAFVSVVPIVLVVAWLYGIMYLAGFAVNVVTSIIGAISIGIGVDFSSHFTMRFLEEHRRGASKAVAISAAGAGTGTALLGSAVTSVAGFGILAFAPMPMFSSYGLLTAIMISLALVASLFVLPSLLVLVTRDDKQLSRRRDQTPALPRLALAADLPQETVAAIADVAEDVTFAPRASAAVVAGEHGAAIEVHWPGASVDEGLAAIPIAQDEVVVAGAGGGSDVEPIPISDLVHALLIADEERLDAVRRMLATETGNTALVQSVEDIPSGLRLAAVTGGAMVLPRSAVEGVGSTTVRSIEPPEWVETVLLVPRRRAGDEQTLAMAEVLRDALSGV